MEQIQHSNCPHCNGIMKPIFSCKVLEAVPGEQPKFQMYVSGHECDDCGHQTFKDNTIDS